MSSTLQKLIYEISEKSTARVLQNFNTEFQTQYDFFLQSYFFLKFHVKIL